MFRSTDPIGSEFCVTIAVVAPASEITCKAFSNTILRSIAGPLFSGERADDDQASGTVYVLRSKSDLPFVAENRDVLHKIGIKGGSVEKRIANASHEATFLLADVEGQAHYWKRYYNTPLGAGTPSEYIANNSRS